MQTVVSVPGVSVAVVGGDRIVHEWATAYLGSCWTVAQQDGPRQSSYAVSGRADPAAFAGVLAAAPPKARPVETFVGVPGVRWADGDQVVVASSAAQLAYRHDPMLRSIEVVGTRGADVAHAVTMLVRELVAYQLEEACWVVYHAACTARDEDCTLVLGPKGAGKTTAAFLLARTFGHALLGNDEVFVRAEGDRVHVLAWPAAPGLGMRLLDSLGWTDRVRASLRAGESQHPGLSEIVAARIKDRLSEPLFDDTGKELKYDVLPQALQSWFGLQLRREGTARRIWFPRISSEGIPAVKRVASEGWHPGPADIKVSSGRYPNFLKLQRASRTTLEGAVTATTHALRELPHYDVVLTHNRVANERMLATVLEDGL